MGDVTRILEKMHASEDPHAADELLSVVYNELYKIAASKMANESLGHTLQPTALVNEAWIRLFPDGQGRKFGNSKHFFCSAAEAMRRILVEHARKKQAGKRGGDFIRMDLPDSQLADIKHPASPDEILAVDEALKRLAVHEPDSAKLVNLHYFTGMNMRETAKALDISERSAERLWAYAKSWLRREIGKDLKP